MILTSFIILNGVGCCECSADFTRSLSDRLCLVEGRARLYIPAKSKTKNDEEDQAGEESNAINSGDQCDK